MASSSSKQASASLQIPSPGSSTHNPQVPAPPGSYRPVSVAVQPTSATTPTSARRQQRASHSVTSSHQQHMNAQAEEPTSPYTDVYSHPAVVAYMAAHPRRTIPRFGPYLLLQTLGEGEFGKVKLGVHVQWGEEVAVKLIRRGNVDTAVRLSKVEREIDVLRSLKHPNIVRLYDVIETDKYIGIILEYASGGELFDHILAHRYLRERDAAKLFSQLISGVWYIHQKKIVHRDLKLENLLLDRHRNVIITDFGFANRFEHKADDLMQTSCGSPCYAAPELVISEGLYVGSAVDIWSCGVILYAMLAGYLPFDDDPANPDGDNINLLYRYIVSTPLSFPDYISTDARDLLGMMLVPDPSRRANLDSVMRHRWLAAHAGAPRTDGHPNAFGKSVEDLEHAALEQHQQRRLAYQRQMRAAATNAHTSTHRRETTRPDVPSRSRSTQPEYLYESSGDQNATHPELPPPPTPVSNVNGSVSGKKPAFGSPSAHGLTPDDPFAPPDQTSAPVVASGKAEEEPVNGSAVPVPPEPKQQPPKGHKPTTSNGPSDFRHTIQVEYDEPKGGRRSEERRARQNQEPVPPQAQQERKVSVQHASKPLPTSPAPLPSLPAGAMPPMTATSRERPSTGPRSITVPTLPPSAAHDIPAMNTTGTLGSNSQPNPLTGDAKEKERELQRDAIREREREKDKDTGSQKSSTASSGRGHRKGQSSMDKFGFSKLFGAGSVGPSAGAAVSNASPVPITPAGKSASPTPMTTDSRAPSESSSVSPTKEKEGRKSRRNTLTAMVEPISRTIRGRGGKNRTATTPTPDPESANMSAASLVPPSTASPSVTGAASATSSKFPKNALPSTPSTSAEPHNNVDTQDNDVAGGASMSASSNKARKVMAWFRTKSKGSPGIDQDELGAGDQSVVVPDPTSVQVTLTTPSATTTRIDSVKVPKTPVAPAMSKRTGSSATDGAFSTPTFVQRFRNSVTVGGHHSTKDHSHGISLRSPTGAGAPAQHPHGQLRIHQGAVDQTTITTRAPPEVIKHVREVLDAMGVEIMVESEYKLRCVRPKRRKGVVGVQPMQIGIGNGQGEKDGASGIAALTMSGSAASNGVDRRGLPMPSQTSFGATGNMLRGLLMRRQSSQVSAVAQSHSQGHASTPPLTFDDDNSVVISPSTLTGDNPLAAAGSVVVLQDTMYGDPTLDAGDEVRFSVELTRIDRLNDTFSLDIRRLKGNLRSYKFLYDTIRQRADLQKLGK